MRIKVIICTRNGGLELFNCLSSVEVQSFPNVDVCVTDDASDDGQTTLIAADFCRRNGWHFIHNDHRMGVVYNQFRAINELYTGDEDDVIVIVDGDDRIMSGYGLQFLANCYTDDTQVTYGSYMPTVEDESFPATPYPYEVRRANSYRAFTRQRVYFNHFRTCRYRIFHGMQESDFQFDDGTWFMNAGDNAMIIPWMELANGRLKFIHAKLCFYTADHPNSANNQHRDATAREGEVILSRPPKEPLFPDWKEPTPSLALAKMYDEIDQWRQCNMLLNCARFYGLRKFVETGTADGSTTICMVSDFDEIHTIEVDPGASKSSRFRLRHYPHVHQYEGTSEEHLPGVVQQLTAPTLFWLDAHYCGGTVRPPQDCPLREELQAIFSSPHRHLIIIDDANLLKGMPGHTDEFAQWPHVDDLTSLAESHDYDWVYQDFDGTLRLTPRELIATKGQFVWE